MQSLLSEFSQEVMNSHVLVCAEIMSGDRISTETLLHLAAETLALDKLTVMVARQSRIIQATQECWQTALECFQACANLWSQLPDTDLTAGHQRLLERLVCNALDRCEFYHVTEADRAIFNAGRDHGLPLAHAEIQ